MRVDSRHFPSDSALDLTRAKLRAAMWIAQNHAGAASCTQACAQFVCLQPRVGTHANLVEIAHSPTAVCRPEDTRIMARKERPILTLGCGIDLQCFGPRKAGAEFHSPGFGNPVTNPLFQFRDERIRRPSQHGREFTAGRSRPVGMRWFHVASNAGPIIYRNSGNRPHIIASLPGQSTLTSDPVVHPLWAGVVGSRGKPEIAKLVQQFTKELRRFW